MRELLEQFFRHYLRERNLEDTLALLTDQVISLGTGEQEVARNKEELRALMECEFKEMPQPLDYELFNYTENLWESMDGVFSPMFWQRLTQKV